MTHAKDEDTLHGGERATVPGGAPEEFSSPLLEGRGEVGVSALSWTAGAPPTSEIWQREVDHAGDYELHGILGQGGFGVVYRAEHIEHGTPAAVKIPHPDLAGDPVTLGRFGREIEAIRRLSHPNVIKILDFGCLEDGRPYFAMELLTGRSLEELIQTRGRLSANEALQILEPLCSALSLAHAHAVVHRDLKPSNVFLCDEEGGSRVVLLDFGIAKLIDGSGASLTSSRTTVGTLSCMAPEQLLTGTVDLQTDVYGLGALLYAMVTGATPFNDVSPLAMYQLLLEGRVPRPSTRARVSPALEEVILRAMSREKDERYPSTEALIVDARRAVARERSSVAPAASAPLERAFGVYLEVLADPDALGAGDARLLADFESILPRARAELAEEGFLPAIDAGTSMLLVRSRPEDPARDEKLRRRVLQALLSLHQSLASRPLRDPRVEVHVCIHGGELLLDADGAFVGGDLLELSAWVAERPLPGVFASAPLLAGLTAQPSAPGPVTLERIGGD